MPHTASLAAEVLSQGQSVRLTISSGVLHIHGEFAGNIDCIVRSVPQLHQKQILENLRVQVLGGLALESALAYEQFGDGALELTFNSAQILKQQPIPGEVRLFWGSATGKPLGMLPLSQIDD